MNLSRLTRMISLSLAFSCFILSSSTIVLAEDISSLPKCLYVSSYHKGYAWSDGVEEGVRSILNGHCEVLQFDMNSKVKKTEPDISQAALEAKALIESWRPDVVITSDDNAAKYLIVPYYKNHELPFVFSGVNWTVEEYNFPFDNVTGIVEVAPIEPMLREASKIAGRNTALYLGAKTLTEEKNFTRIKLGAEHLNITLEKNLVHTFDDWKDALVEAQTADFIVMGSNSGIEGWDEEEARAFALANSHRVSVTNHKWMMGVTTLGYTKIPQEHGEWAAQVALAILAGTGANDIPITTNRKWDLWINQKLGATSQPEIPATFYLKAKRFYNDL